MKLRAGHSHEARDGGEYSQRLIHLKLDAMAAAHA